MKQYSPDGLPLPDFAVIVTWCVSAGRSLRNHAVLVIPSGAKMYSCENDASCVRCRRLRRRRPSAGRAARPPDLSTGPQALVGASFFHFFEWVVARVWVAGAAQTSERKSSSS